MAKAKFILILIAFGIPVAVFGQTDWPGFMSRLEPGRSESSVSAAIPADVKVMVPPTDLAAERAKWSGYWFGWACPKKACDAGLVVESVDANGANLVFTYASSMVPPYSVRAAARFVDDELHATLPDEGGRVAYRMQRDGLLWFKWTRGQTWVAGVLSQNILTPEEIQKRVVPVAAHEVPSGRQAASEAPESCRAFLGRWTGQWPQYGQKWLTVATIDGNCVAQCADSTDKSLPLYSQKCEIKDRVLIRTKQDGAEYYELRGDELWARYVFSGGQNNTVYRRIESPPK